MNNKLKVLLISARTSGSPGGIAEWTESYLSACSQTDIECDLVNIAQIGKRAAQGNDRIHLKEEITRTLSIFRQLNFCLQSSRYDVAHINCSCGRFGLIRDFLCAKKIRKTNLPIVLHFHCDIPFWISNRFSYYFLKRIVRLSDSIVVLCENSQQYLKSEFERDSVKMPNFVDESFCTEKHLIRDVIQKILFVGYIQPEKGVIELYTVARKFPKIEFVLAGEMRPDIRLMEKPDNITCLGRVNKERVGQLIDDSDLFLFPTHSEGFSLSLSECMSRGLPVIATDVGANKDMLEEQGGSLVKIGDVNSIVLAIKRLQNPMLRQEMSTWNIEKVKKNYTALPVVERFCAIYRSCIRN